MEKIELPKVQIKRRIIDSPSDVGVFILILIMYSWVWLFAAWVSWRIIEWLFI